MAQRAQRAKREAKPEDNGQRPFTREDFYRALRKIKKEPPAKPSRPARETS
jgi:hypothetical protein